MNRRLRLAAVAALCTLVYMLVVGIAVAVSLTFVGGSTGLSVGIVLAAAVTWRLFYIIAEVIDA